jgi:hypothetical protein
MAGARTSDNGALELCVLMCVTNAPQCVVIMLDGVVRCDGQLRTGNPTHGGVPLAAHKIRLTPIAGDPLSSIIRRQRTKFEM